jgi:hypothetical protein
VNFNAGCGVKLTGSSSSYGESFNRNNGGFYVMSKTRFTGVQIWFWSRDSPYIPQEIRDGAAFDEHESISPNLSWGAPAANFPMYPGYCDYTDHFNAHKMVFDLTFCVCPFYPLSVNPSLTPCLHRATGPELFGPDPAVALAPALTVRKIY